MRYTLVLLACLTLGCLNKEVLRSENRASMVGLRLGMDKSEVFQVMGDKKTYDGITNPYRTSAFTVDSHIIEVVYYYTDMKAADGAITDDELTPIVLIDGEVTGWGWDYWHDQALRLEIRLR